ncbi:universal stress protein [Bradyrhizobium tropiciagri]|uniref:universal stress protein n=1 Tax=Bradyrhizobium tropiciagri TaxID=312253 RepID=UPI00067CB01D|nr:universal stress protein [Bradyrhizobium tropiciagri]
MYRHILIPTDGSELAEHGLRHGLALAKSLGAKASVIFVVEPLSEIGGQYRELLARYSEIRKEEAAGALDRATRAAKEAGAACETSLVESGRPDQAIIAAAKDKGCDLIVMSSHGRSGLSALLIGSVTNKVLTQAKTPVLVCQ